MPTLTTDPQTHAIRSELARLQAAYARKAERVLADPVYRSQLPIAWWQADLQPITELQNRLGQTSRLDPWTTSVESLHRDTADQRYRFRAHALERQYWLTHLPEVETSQARLDRWRKCGSDAWIYQDVEDHTLHVRSDTCHLRICPVCRQRYAAAAKARIRYLLDGMQPRTWQFVTLTMRHTRAPLRLQCDTLKSSFRRLRQRQLWRSAATHGYAVIEVTYNAKSDEWHPHLHVLVKCRYIDWHKLRKDWIAVTGGSSVIDCGYVRNQANAIRYLTDYIGKPPDLTKVTDPTRIAEYYAAIQCARWMLPFGSPPKPPSKPALDTPRTMIPIGKYAIYYYRALRGDTNATDVIRSLATGQPAPKQLSRPLMEVPP